jgi:hypothetical protein
MEETVKSWNVCLHILLGILIDYEGRLGLDQTELL